MANGPLTPLGNALGKTVAGALAVTYVPVTLPLTNPTCGLMIRVRVDDNGNLLVTTGS